MQVDLSQADWGIFIPALVLLVAGLLLMAEAMSKGRFSLPGYLGYFWIFLLIGVIIDFSSFTPAVWLMALVSFRALREYFSLVDLRLEDRWGILVSYLSIPFMVYLIQIDWYGFFIISIPIYAFVIVPFLVTVGDSRGQGSLFSIGVIDFGLFCLVFCLGHIAYLAYFSTWLVLLFLLAVVGCNVTDAIFAGRNRISGFILSCLVSLALTLGLRTWTLIPAGPAVFLGFLIPSLVYMGNYTVGVLEIDLGISPADLEPGRGRVLDSLKSYLFTAPIVFHFLRWTMKFGELIHRHGD